MNKLTAWKAVTKVLETEPKLSYLYIFGGQRLFIQKFVY